MRIPGGMKPFTGIMTRYWAGSTRQTRWRMRAVRSPRMAMVSTTRCFIMIRWEIIRRGRAAIVEAAAAAAASTLAVVIAELVRDRAIIGVINIETWRGMRE